tara:strand:- start:33224 stop:33871 length:648 start_codon:yes stop_codon:yes gene_type:complete
MVQSKSQQQEEERRRYFRINDEVFFSFRVISEAEKETLGARIKAGEDLCPDNYYAFIQLETEISDLIHKVRNQDSELSHSIELLNRKMNLIAKGPPTPRDQDSIFNTAPETINLSGCGIGFLSGEKLEEGTFVEIQMVLLPEKSYIFCTGIVSNSGKSSLSRNLHRLENKPFRTGADFEAIRPEDSEKIIQHVIKREVENLRENKRQNKDKRHLD